jgi:hypothetical protein
MKFSRLVFALGLMAGFAPAGSWAQTALTSTPTALTLSNNGSAFTSQGFYAGGDTFTVTGCTNNTANTDFTSAGTCVTKSGETLSITGSIFRGVVTLDLKCTAGCTNSSLLNGVNPTLGLTVTVSRHSPATYQAVSEVDGQAIGANTANTFHGVSQGVTFAAGTGTESFTNFTNYITSSVTNPTGSSINSSNTSTWTVTENLALSTTASAGENITQAILTFYKTPEPASIAIMLLGMTGLGATRMRRRRA